MATGLLGRFPLLFGEKISFAAHQSIYHLQLILVFNKTVKNRFIRLLFQQPAA